MGSIGGTELCRCAADPEPHFPQFFCRLLWFTSLLWGQLLTCLAQHPGGRSLPWRHPFWTQPAGSLYLFRVKESFLFGSYDAFAVLPRTAARRFDSRARSSSYFECFTSPASSRRPRPASRSASESAMKSAQ